MSSNLRIALGADGVSIWSSDIFGRSDPSRLRDFLARAFAVDEVDTVELRRANSFGRIRYAAVPSPAQIWKKLSRALGASAATARSTPATPERRFDTNTLYLGAPSQALVRIGKVGDVLSTWHVRGQAEGRLRLSHPLLRNRRDVVFRLEEELAGLYGVDDFRASAISAAVSIRFDSSATSAARVVLELEKAWPRLLEGTERPRARGRLVASIGLAGLAYTGQYVAPAVRPIALAGVALYSAPNVVNAIRGLTRAEVGLPALYSTGLAFMFASGLPFTAGVMAALMQLWPHLAERKAVLSQRRLFARQRRVPTWARLQRSDGSTLDMHVDDVRVGDLVQVRGGEVLPVDGVVESGTAALLEEATFGGSLVSDRSAGDSVSAGALLQAGSLSVRVRRSGAQSSARYIESLLPHASIAALPASLEAERIANRNAKPALALSALTLLLTRTVLPAQALLRPDYATAPRLGAQLAAFYDLGRAFQLGVVFRDPGALDRLDAAEVYVIDDSAGLDRPSVEVAAVQSVAGVPADHVVAYALAAHPGSHGERGLALQAFALQRKAEPVTARSLEHAAGVIRYLDARGDAIAVASSAFIAAQAGEIPAFATRLVRRRAADGAGSALAEEQAELRPFWVLRGEQIIGVVTFTRTGAIVGKHLIGALAARSNELRKPARVIYLAGAGQQEARAVARGLGIEVHVAASAAERGDFIRGLGRPVLWLGDGSRTGAQESVAASSVSLSVAPRSGAPDDVADVLLGDRGLASLPALLDIGRAHTARLARDYQVVYGANLLGVAGAFLAAANGLQVGLLSNVGTGLVYARHAMALGALGHLAEQKHRRLLARVTRASRAAER